MLSLTNGLLKKTTDKLVIDSLEDYQKLTLDENILMSLVHFKGGLFISSGIEFYTYIRELRGTTNSMLEKCQNLGRVNLTLKNLAQLRKDFKNFSLVSFDQWRANRHVPTA